MHERLNACWFSVTLLQHFHTSIFVGLSVVYLSGKKGPGGPGCYSQDDVDALRALAEEPGIVDLFLTYPFFLIMFVPLPASIDIELLWFSIYSVCLLTHWVPLTVNIIALTNGQLEWWTWLTLLMCLIRFLILMGMILLLLNWLPRLSQGLISNLIHHRKMFFEKVTLKHPNYT